jgi:hypothetical protein
MSSPTDEPAELGNPVAEDPEAYGFYTEHGGFMQLISPGPMPEPNELSDEERREAMQRYIEARYGKIMRGNYTSMVHRATDGSDPLVQEPKGKPCTNHHRRCPQNHQLHEYRASSISGARSFT